MIKISLFLGIFSGINRLPFHPSIQKIPKGETLFSVYGRAGDYFKLWQKTDDTDDANECGCVSWRGLEASLVLQFIRKEKSPLNLGSLIPLAKCAGVVCKSRR